MRIRVFAIATAVLAALTLGATGVVARNVITHTQFNVTREKCESFPLGQGTVTICFTGHSVFHEVDQPDGDFVIVRNTDTVATATLNGEFYSFDDFQDHSHVAFQAGQLREFHERTQFTSRFVIDGVTYACSGTTHYHFASGEVKVDEPEITCTPPFPPATLAAAGAPVAAAGPGLARDTEAASSDFDGPWGGFSRSTADPGSEASMGIRTRIR
jgi:hypothetical protein